MHIKTAGKFPEIGGKMQKTLFKVIQRLEADDSLMRFDVVSQSVDELKSLLKHSHETKPPETGEKPLVERVEVLEGDVSEMKGALNAMAGAPNA
jgi:hypothetical protein